MKALHAEVLFAIAFTPLVFGTLSQGRDLVERSRQTLSGNDNSLSNNGMGAFQNGILQEMGAVVDLNRRSASSTRLSTTHSISGVSTSKSSSTIKLTTTIRSSSSTKVSSSSASPFTRETSFANTNKSTTTKGVSTTTTLSKAKASSSSSSSSLSTKASSTIKVPLSSTKVASTTRATSVSKTLSTSTKSTSTTKVSSSSTKVLSTTKASSLSTTVKISASSAKVLPTTKASSTSKASVTTKSSLTAKTSSTHSSVSTSVVDLAWKGGLSGFPDIQTLDIFTSEWMPYISWYSNYQPLAPNMNATNHTVVGAPMLWGKGDQCLTGPDGPVDQWRMGNFTEYVETGDTDPAVFFGFYEPDCDCNSSSHIVDVQVGVQKWNQLLKPLASRGIKLGSPPMCTQLDQSWLTEFNASGVSWDITSIHVNKPTAAEGMEVVEYYSKFGKPVWVSEFTCVDDQNWSSCGNQSVVNTFITEMVAYFESNDNVIAYGANTGEGVPGLWNLMTDTWPKQLSPTGEHYQATLKTLCASSGNT